MDITIFIGGLSGGGAERVVCNLSNYLSKNHNVTILTMSEDKPAYYLRQDIDRISLLGKDNKQGKILNNIKRLIKLKNYITSTNTDIYIVMLPITINLLLAFRRMIKVPIIVAERGDPSVIYKKSKLNKFFMETQYSKADNYVFQTKGAQEFYKPFIEKKGVIIPNAINEDFIRAEYLNIRREAIVTVGRFSQQKNFKMLIEAFSRITNDFPNYRLEIYGDGILKEELIRQVYSLGIEERVVFPGYVNEIGEHIEDASLFVLPSNYEGMPNALMEAMVLGIPSISTDCPVGGPKYLINDGINGFLVPVGDTDKLTQKMREILRNKKLASQFSEESRKIIEKLNPEKIYGLWEKTILETVEDRKYI